MVFNDESLIGMPPPKKHMGHMFPLTSSFLTQKPDQFKPVCDCIAINTAKLPVYKMSRVMAQFIN